MIKINITKREELVIFASLLTLLMLLFYIIPLGVLKFAILPVLLMVVFLVTIFVGREGLRKIELFLLPILPVAFTVSSALFYNVIPGRWLTRFAFIGTYGFLIYSIFLIINIFNAAKLKNIQLLKVARTIYFFVSSFTFFLFAYIILSFHLIGFLNALIIGVFAALLSLTFFWSFSLKNFYAKQDTFLSLVAFLIIFELSLAISFWPINIYLVSLFLTSVYYSFMGICHRLLEFNTRGWNMMEYALINIFIFALCILSVNFG